MNLSRRERRGERAMVSIHVVLLALMLAVGFLANMVGIKYVIEL